MRRSKQFNAPMLVLSIVIGVVAWFVCAVLYSVLRGEIPDPMLIGLLFGVLALAIAIGVFLISNASGTFEKNVVTGGSAGSILVILIIGVVLTAALGGLFQWIYSLRFTGSVSKPTSYVFLIDNSGSMEKNDPLQLRYKAIEDVMKGQKRNFPYMVYGFADDVVQMRDMLPANQDTGTLRGSSEGQTAMGTVLKTVINDYENGRWDGGKMPKVILLTDGLPTDLPSYKEFQSFADLQPILDRYTEHEITVSTVSLGNGDTELMKYIADSTGGDFVDVSDASMLSQGMTSAAGQYSTDDLVTTRYNGGSLDLLFGFLRVLFITLLGTFIGLFAGAAYGQTDSMSLVLLSSVVKSLIGALLLEVCTSLLGLPDRILWFILWVLIAALLCNKAAALRRGPERPRGPTRPKRRGKSNRDLTRF